MGRQGHAVLHRSHPVPLRAARCALGSGVIPEHWRRGATGVKRRGRTAENTQVTEPAARWRIVGFYVVFAAFMVGAAAVLVVFLTTKHHPTTHVAIPAALGLVMGGALVLIPKSVKAAPWVFTAPIVATAFAGPSLHGAVGDVALSFAAGAMGVMSAYCSRTATASPLTLSGVTPERWRTRRSLDSPLIAHSVMDGQGSHLCEVDLRHAGRMFRF